MKPSRRSSDLQRDISSVIQKHIVLNNRKQAPLSTADILLALVPSVTTAFALSRIRGEELEIMVASFGGLILANASKIQATLSADEHGARN